MTTQVAKWGNSLGLRLPKAVALEARIEDGDTVEVFVQNGAIIVRPAKPRYALDELVARITAKNRHDSPAWSAPAGKEAW